jgi:hypothetical protein
MSRVWKSSTCRAAPGRRPQAGEFRHLLNVWDGIRGHQKEIARPRRPWFRRKANGAVHDHPLIHADRIGHCRRRGNGNMAGEADRAADLSGLGRGRLRLRRSG